MVDQYVCLLQREIGCGSSLHRSGIKFNPRARPVRVRDESRDLFFMFFRNVLYLMTYLNSIDKAAVSASISHLAVSAKEQKSSLSVQEWDWRLTKLHWSEGDSPSASRMSLSCARLDMWKWFHQCLSQVCHPMVMVPIQAPIWLFEHNHDKRDRERQTHSGDFVSIKEHHGQYRVVHSSRRCFVFLKKDSTVTTRREKVNRVIVNALRHRWRPATSTV